MIENKIKVIIPFYNPGKFLERCINSVLTQDYDNFEVLFIDDCSTDGSYEKLPYKGSNHHLLSKTKSKNTEVWKREKRLSALPNLHQGIMEFSKDSDDIVVIVDGDDWLINKKVLTEINDFYNENTDCWMMYGSSNGTNGMKCCSREYTEKEFEDLRKSPFKISHIRTFRAGLYHNLEKQDPKLTSLKDSNGNWYQMTYDVAMFLPMLEMAGKKHVYHNTKQFYIYNRENPISDDKVNQKLQTSIHMEINKKPKFKKIETYK
jgi:glycosyltransferase involved in cell wall biosynthesis